MLNEKKLRLILFVAVAAVHALLILFLAFNVKAMTPEEAENARVMKVTDLEEAPPPPPPEPELPLVEAIAETMIETDTAPLQTVAGPGAIITSTWEDYLPQHKVSELPKFNEREIAAAVVYPPIALRSGIEGRVILELFIDQNGLIQQIRVMGETPKERGFADAAVRALAGKRASPAMANGQPVSCRYRYPVTFKIK
ncbi:MAG: energy transducer TonB [Treponema sp.]|jgi:protein TonB|nr:energy transducer TonB [Treponema sp.]